MKYLIIVLTLFFIQNTFAQLPSINANVEELRKELNNITIQNQKLIRDLDSIKLELRINRALMDADQKRAMETLEYSSKIVDLSGWIMAFIGVAFLIIGYFGFREVRSFHEIRKRMNKSANFIQKEIDEIENTSKNLVNIIYWSNEGLDKYLTGNYEKAEYFFKRIKEIRSNDYETCYRLGKVYSAMGNYYMATKEFEQAIRINPNLSDAYFGLGWNYKSQKEFNKAIENYQKGIEITYGFYGLCGLGHLNMEASKLKEAKECFIKSIKEKPNSGSSFPLGNIYLFESDNKTASKYYDKTLEYVQIEMIERPDYFWAYYNKVGAEIGLNKIESAKISLQKALSKNSGIEILRNILFQFEFMKKTNKISNEIDYFIDRLNKEIELREPAQ